MLVNAADFKFPSKSTFWNKNKTWRLQMCRKMCIDNMVTFFLSCLMNSSANC
jgi:hypothetical protein